MKKLFATLHEKWAEYLLEICVIIIGITISLFLDQWRENTKNHQVEQKILRSIQEDLTKDTVTLNRTIQTVKILINSCNQLLDDTKTVTSDSMAIFLDHALTYTKFQSTEIAYTELQQTGSSKLIQNRVLMDKIVHHYETLLDITKEWDDVDKSFIMDRMLPHSFQAFQYSDHPNLLFGNEIQAKQAIKTDNELRNLLKANKIFKSTILLVYTKIKADTKKLIDEIEVELKQ